MFLIVSVPLGLFFVIEITGQRYIFLKKCIKEKWQNSKVKPV